MAEFSAEAGGFEAGRALSGNAAHIRFSDEIGIYADQPRLIFSKAGVPAYAAEGEGRASRNLLAYLCDPFLSPRSLKAYDYAALSNSHLMRLVSAGPVMWTPEHRRRYAFIYELPAGKRLMEKEAAQGPKLRTDVMVQSVLKPMIGVLRDLRGIEIVHGEINPANMFGELNGNMLERFILGECLCLPPSYNQMPLYETIERAMTQSSGKGPGLFSDDLYALGVTLAVLIRQHDPMAGFTRDQIIRTKIEQGTYAAVLGKDTINGSHLELLRGLMQDEPAQRWTLDDLENWVDGRRETPKASGRKRKSTRPLILNGKKYFHPEILAFEMFENISDTQRTIDSGEFEQWVSRALEDSQTENRMRHLKAAIEESGSSGPGDRRMMSAMSMALHPRAPLRFDNVSIMPQGIGAALTHVVGKKGDINPYVFLLQSKLVVQWLEMQENEDIDVSAIFGMYESCRNYLNQTQSGYGFERVLYTLDGECPCLSEKIVRYHARTPEEILAAFEELIKGGDKPLRLFDRHVCAFLMARDRKIEPHLVDINSTIESKKLYGELGALASIQKRSRSAPLPHLSKWFASQQDLFLSRIHDREERQRISESILNIAGQGDLSKLTGVIDNPRMKRADTAMFMQAMREYQSIEKESQVLQRELQTNPAFGRGTGRNFAAALSALIAFIIMIGTVLVYLTRGDQGMF